MQQEKKKTIVEHEEVYVRKASVKSDEDEELKNSSNVDGGTNSGKENQGISRKVCKVSSKPDTSKTEESMYNTNKRKEELKWGMVKNINLNRGESSGGISPRKGDNKSDSGCKSRDQSGTTCITPNSGLSVNSVHAIFEEFTGVTGDIASMSNEIHVKFLESKNKKMTGKDINTLKSAVDVCSTFASLLARLEENVSMVRMGLKDYVEDWCQIVKKNQEEGTEEKTAEANKNSEEDNNNQSDKDYKRKMQQEKEKNIAESEVVYKKEVDDQSSEDKELQICPNVEEGTSSGVVNKTSSRETCKRYHNPDTSKTEVLKPNKKKRKEDFNGEKLKQKYADGEKNSGRKSLMKRDSKGDGSCETNDQTATCNRILPSGLSIVSIHLIMKKFRSVVVDTVDMIKEILEKLLECENKKINLQNIDSLESAVAVCNKFSSLFVSLEVNVGMVREGLEEYVKEWCEIVKKDIEIKQTNTQENKERSANIGNRSCDPDTSEMEESMLSKMMQRVDLKREEMRQRNIIEECGGKSLTNSDTKSLKNDLGCEFNNQTATSSRILPSGISESSIHVVLNKFRSVIAITVGMSKEIQEKLLESENKDITIKNINSLESVMDLSTKFSSLLAWLECKVRKIRNELEEYVKEWCQTVKKDKIRKNKGYRTREKAPEGILSNLGGKKWTDSRKKEHSRKMRKHWKDKKKNKKVLSSRVVTDQRSHQNVRMNK